MDDFWINLHTVHQGHNLLQIFDLTGTDENSMALNSRWSNGRAR
jgi:hypothetical protein